MSTNYFISYTTRTEVDKQRAVWVEWVLRVKLGCKTKMQEYDSKMGGNFKLFMDDALKWADVVVLILSNSYLKSDNCREEWANADEVLPIRFDGCKPEGILKRRTYLDLNGLDKGDARKKLIDSIIGIPRPGKEPVFPKKLRGAEKEPVFPLIREESPKVK